MKRCTRCQKEKPLNDFHSRKDRSSGYRSQCKLCARIGRKPQSGGKVTRAHRRKWRYNLTNEEFKMHLTLQNDLCAICCNPPKENKELVVDHDHSCCPTPPTCGRCTRGLLCHSCNTALARLGDSLEGISKVLAYLSYKAPQWT
jgi:hypothetical protein